MENGLLDTATVDAVVEYYEHAVGPMNGARVVARAWVDPEFRERLLEDGTTAIGELGFGGPEGEHMVVVENTDQVHNAVVCTSCSCYPWPCSGFLRTGTRRAPYGLAWCENHACCWRRWGTRSRRGRDTHLGLLSRGPLPRAAAAPGGHEELDEEGSPASSPGTR